MITLREVVDIFGSFHIKTRGRWVPMTDEYIKGWDLDLKFGKMGEEFTRNVFEGNSKVEVKTERDIWKTTGNIAIEIRYKNRPSGITTTESGVWVHLLAYDGNIEGGFIFKVNELKDKIRKRKRDNNLKIVMGGDDNLSQLVLLPIKDLFPSVKAP